MTKPTAQNYDVIIVGAGPAGCCAAIALAQGNKKVCLIDKATFPREKTCGDAISAKSYSVLRKLGLLEAFRSVPKHTIEGALFSAPNGKEISLRFNENSAGKKINGAVLPRKEFDLFLFHQAQKAGVATLESCEFKSLHRTVENTLRGAVVHLEEREAILYAPIVIGADGCTSKIAQEISPQTLTQETTLISGRSYMSGVTDLSDQIEIHFLPEVYPGYLWIFPHSDTKANVGIGIAKPLLDQSDTTLPDLFQKALSSPQVAHRFSEVTQESKFRAWQIPTHYRKGNCIEKNGVFLVGDAAGIVDIFTGEGVGNAMKSGLCVAEVILDELPEGHYTKTIAKEMSQELKMSRGIYTMTRKMPWFFNKVVGLCEKSPRLLQWLLDVAMDDSRRKELLNPANYLRRFRK